MQVESQIITFKNKCTSLLIGGTFGKLIEYVKIPLIFYLSDHTPFLQQIIGDLRSYGFTLGIEHYFKIFSLLLGDLSIIANNSEYCEHTCRLELLLRSVFAHPKLSSNGFVAKTMSLISWMLLSCPPDTAAMYCIIRFAASVLPAPDSPEMMTHWFSWYAFML
jgi:hypothetical protein